VPATVIEATRTVGEGAGVGDDAADGDAVPPHADTTNATRNTAGTASARCI